MPSLLIFVAILAAGFYALVHRLLVHKERMTALEAKRPKVILQLPEGSSSTDIDELTQKIMEACQAKGIYADVDTD